MGQFVRLRILFGTLSYRWEKLYRWCSAHLRLRQEHIARTRLRLKACRSVEARNMLSLDKRFRKCGRLSNEFLQPPRQSAFQNFFEPRDSSYRLSAADWCIASQKHACWPFRRVHVDIVRGRSQFRILGRVLKKSFHARAGGGNSRPRTARMNGRRLILIVLTWLVLRT